MRSAGESPMDLYCSPKFSSHATRSYADVEYTAPTYLIFGRESVGLPRELVENAGSNALRIPMRPTLRCLNLSNSVAIAAYECMRQKGFEGLSLSFGEE